MEKLKKEFIVEVMHRRYTIDGLVNAWSISVVSKDSWCIDCASYFCTQNRLINKEMIENERVKN